jgi:hypothetical protein
LTEPLAGQVEGPVDLMGALRAHRVGDPPASPTWSLLRGGLHAPCVHAGGLLASSQTTASWVSDLRARPRHWATATSAPCTSLFKPVDVGSPLDLGRHPMNVFDERSLWWRHELLHRRTMASHAPLLSRYRRDRDRTEAQWAADPPSSVEAFEQADGLAAAWLAEVAAAPLPDTRPSWVRRSWRSIDRAARIDPPAVGTTAGAGPLR